MYTSVVEQLRVKREMLRIRKRWTKHFFQKYLEAPTVELREAYEVRLLHHTQRREQLEKDVERLSAAMQKLLAAYRA